MPSSKGKQQVKKPDQDTTVSTNSEKTVNGDDSKTQCADCEKLCSYGSFGLQVSWTAALEHKNVAFLCDGCLGVRSTPKLLQNVGVLVGEIADKLQHMKRAVDQTGDSLQKINHNKIAEIVNISVQKTKNQVGNAVVEQVRSYASAVAKSNAIQVNEVFREPSKTTSVILGAMKERYERDRKQ